MNDPITPKLVQIGLPDRVSRRAAMQWVMAAIAASSFPSTGKSLPVGRTVTPQEEAATQPAPTAHGYGADPKLTITYKPGDLWPLTFSADQRKTVRALADTIIPADHLGPAASAVGVVEMIDEWISAPYPRQQGDRPVILDGLVWLENESRKRFSKGFQEVTETQKRAICDDICFAADAMPIFEKASHFFGRFRSLCAAAYYATPQGWKAIGYVGNVALERFEGPPPEVLEKLGLIAGN
ncbi:MAG TPA: gluconate 2-dehydrogenase subunit 3 family protein [Humisphaera sp.]|nr:gluconate 2-dehydrogenase subunit 3 family protein [Humisphaera sp.]